MKDRINKKNWTLHLSGSNSASVPNSLFLTDDSEYSASTASPVGPRFNVISGSAGVGTVGTTFGHFYPNMGTIVLSTQQLSASIPGLPSTIISTSLAGLVKDNGFAQDDNATADNALKMVRAIQLGTDTSFRSEEDQTSIMYFCRAKAAHFNYTNNPTFTSGSDNGFRQRTMEGNPQTFITTVGLYDAQDTLVAVGKLSTPVQKNYSSEAVIKAKLTY